MLKEGRSHGSVQALSTSLGMVPGAAQKGKVLCCLGGCRAGTHGDQGCVSGERQRAHTAGVPVGEVKQKGNPSVGRAAIVESEVMQQYTANALLQ